MTVDHFSSSSQASIDNIGVHRHIVVIGAGPFGLALAAKLQAANADYILFGRVMSFWREHVPSGTRLLFSHSGCSLSSNGFGSGAYESSRGARLPNPLPAEEFVAYGLWFQQNTCRPPDERTVVNVTHANGTFAIRLDDGDEITADHLVLAIGLRPFAFRPQEFAALPPEFVSHTSDLHNLDNFHGMKVAIIGSGQSALECASLLAEKNADVEVLARSRHLAWRHFDNLEWSSTGTTPSMRTSIRAALNDPDVYRRLPGFVRALWLKRTLRPAGSNELRTRLDSVRIALGSRVKWAHVKRNRVELDLCDHSTRTVDHVVLGTGYRIDVNAISFIAPELRRRIALRGGYPVLNGAMESTVPHLYFTGPAAARDFGPTMWFVLRSLWAAERISSVLHL